MYNDRSLQNYLFKFYNSQLQINDVTHDCLMSLLKCIVNYSL